jgi:hypothetical protein
MTQPESLGRLMLVDRNPRTAPRIEYRFLSAPQDLRRMMEGVNIARRIGRMRHSRRSSRRRCFRSTRSPHPLRLKKPFWSSSMPTIIRHRPCRWGVVAWSTRSAACTAWNNYASSTRRSCRSRPAHRPPHSHGDGRLHRAALLRAPRREESLDENLHKTAGHYIRNGVLRSRCPVARKIAFAMAGPIGPTGGSPTSA